MRVDIPIRFSDFDCFGHVNHARMLVFCEEHRTEMFSRLEAQTGERWYDSGLVVARIEADYRQPIGTDSRVARVEASLVGIGRTSLRIRYRIEIHTGEAAAILATLVRVDASGLPMTVSEPAREWLRSHLAADANR